MSKSFFFVESPLQLLCAIEAKNHFKFLKNILIIRLNNSNLNNKQILKTLEYDNSFEEIIILKIDNTFSLYKVGLIFIKLLLNKYDKIFVGDIRSRIVKFFKKFIRVQKLYLLDDGLPTLSYYERDTKINIFSFLDLENNSNCREIVKNDFSFLKSKPILIKKRVEKNLVYFIGAPLVEKDVISLVSFKKRLNSIVSYYNERNMTFVYLPHRAESKEKLEDFDFDEIINCNIPIELAMIQSEILPEYFSSFYSAGLYTLNVLFKENVQVNSFYISDVNKRYKQEIEKCYNYYSNNFKVIYEY